MAYVLYGSKTSPFVRRTRILMEKLPYEFKEVDIFGADAQMLKEINPVNQIPILTDGEKTIWDSRLIFNYLNGIHHFKDMDVEAENLLTAIDGAMNAAVALLLLRRSGIDLKSDNTYIKRQRERIEGILDYLNPFMKGPALSEWNVLSISLYCFLDWASFRDLISLDHRPDCQELLKTYSNKQIVKETEIPKV